MVVTKRVAGLAHFTLLFVAANLAEVWLAMINIWEVILPSD